MQRGANQSFCRLPGSALLFFIVVLPTCAIQNRAPQGPSATSSTSAPQPLINPDGDISSRKRRHHPRLIYAADADFSEAARRKKISSVTVISLIVGTDGLPREVRVARSAADGVNRSSEGGAVT
jgi:outer membrane biosynthesis protein TonB